MSKHNFIFENWFNSLNHSGYIHNDYKQSLLELGEHKINISRFDTAYNLVPNNFKFIEKDCNNKYFVDIQLSNFSDITTYFVAYPYHGSENVWSDISLKLIINDIILPIHTNFMFVNACAIYTKNKIRIIFKNEPFPIRFKYTSYVLDYKLRLELMNKTFIHNNIKYIDGLAISE
jgi:hypothetical protein